MCWSREEGIQHECIATCPMCWIFTESNILKLLAGETLQIGSALDLIYACQIYTWDVNATLSITGEPNDEKERSDLESVIIKTTNPPIDMWKDLHFRREQILRDPDLDRPGMKYEVTNSYRFRIGLFAKDDTAVKYVRQKHASPSVASQETFDFARNWISECLLSHEKCPTNPISVLPRRVLRVLPTDRNINLWETDAEMEQYTALSYCWGKTSNLMLTTQNLETFKKGMEVVDLPKTFQDAILITRKLGIPNLWIDSLCIIQDSEDDKSREISEMAHIYKNAAVTISAAIASDCNRGFLEEREDIWRSMKSSYSLPFFQDVEKEGLGKATGQIYLCPDAHVGYTVGNEKATEATDKRAWTLQESWLSPRLLIYGSGPLEWRCLSRTLVQGMRDKIAKPGDFDLIGYIHEGLYRNREKFFRVLTSSGEELEDWKNWNSHLQYQTLPSWLTDWMRLVEAYTSRQLTNQRDKLPALSALAKEFHRLTGDKYLAGLWEQSLPWGLLWTRRASPIAVNTGIKSIKYSEEEMHNFYYGTESESAFLAVSKDLPIPKKQRGWSKIHPKLFSKKKSRVSTPELDSEGGSSRDPRLKHPYVLGNSSIIILPYEIRTRFELNPPFKHPPESSLKSRASSYISPSWSFACSDGRVTFEINSWDNLNSKIIIHSADTRPCTSIAPFAEVESGHIILTGPLQRMSLREVGARFVLCESNPHIFWDYIILDRPIGGNDYIKREILAAGGITHLGNRQLEITEHITKETFDPKKVALPESSSLLPTPPASTIEKLLPRRPKIGVWFLEVTWTETPRGLVLVRRSDGLFERIGIFKCARNDWETADWRTRGSQTVGPRDWVWYERLRMCTITIV